VPGGSYWKYSQLWATTNSWLAFLVTFTLYIQDEKLASKQKVSVKPCLVFVRIKSAVSSLISPVL
jgi:hypothetical protein